MATASSASRSVSQQEAKLTPAPDFLAIGSVIIDDIVYPDGRASMGVLGGGGAHAAYGMALAGERPGLVALVGEDLPADIRERFTRDFDARGLVSTHYPQARGWQIFEWNGLRNEIFRVDVVEPFMYGPAPDDPGIPFQAARGFTLLRGPEHVAGWRKRFPGAMLLWEPVRVFMLSADQPAFLRGLAASDIVSPNLHEAQTMYDVQDEREVMRRMLADGAQVAALRMGESGSLVARAGDSHAWHIPAVSLPELVDQTGAGNTYCGAFLVGLAQSGDLVRAGCYGAAAASFALEHVGCAQIPADLADQWRWRLDEAMRGVEQVSLG